MADKTHPRPRVKPARGFDEFPCTIFVPGHPLIACRIMQKCGGTSRGIARVLRFFATLIKLGVHVEVSRDGALAYKRPFQVLRFVPFGDTPLSLEPTIEKVRRLCHEIRQFLPFTCLFNSPGTYHRNTICPPCGKTVITHPFYGPMGPASWPVFLRADVPAIPRCRCNGHRRPFKVPPAGQFIAFPACRT